ncbi:hypothetical protein [Natrinema sp. H-ect4]|uniref:hypothetical protein n=1 Tax=Natrinema sp. H-ect4 TaxID=3242699 RepID=UPI0035A99C4B
MSRQRYTPPWYVEGDIGTSIRNAQEVGEDRDQIVSTLSKTELEDLPKHRIEAIVDATPDRNTEAGNLPLSQAPSTDATPRDPPARVLDTDDLEYLSRRELARIVGLTLEQFEGNTVRPAGNQEIALDLYWHRQQMTVGLRTVPMTGEHVGTEHVDAVIDGPIRIKDTRAPSELVVVTNGSFSDRASELASENGVRLFNGSQVDTWLRRTALSPRVVGTLLEDGEDHDGPLDDLVDSPSIPEPRQTEDPFEVDRGITLTFHESNMDGPLDGGEGSEVTKREPKTTENDLLGGEQSPAGETGTLYADPDEDGDYEAFDKYLEDL